MSSEAPHEMYCLPHFIIIGVMKAGTTFLDKYLQMHPNISIHEKKEVFYFNFNYFQGIEWYGSHFYYNYGQEALELIGEATPLYFNNPLATVRIYNLLPKVKLIVIVRDPVSRTLSQFVHAKAWLKRNNFPDFNISFEQAIYEEEALLDYCVRGKPVKKPYADSDNWKLYWNCWSNCSNCFHAKGVAMFDSGHPAFGILAKGLYYEQLIFWLQFYPPNQFLFLRYEDIIDGNPTRIFQQVEDFLEIPYAEWPDRYDYVNTNKYSPMEEKTRQFLINFYREDTKNFYKLIDRDFGWQQI